MKKPYKVFVVGSDYLVSKMFSERAGYRVVLNGKLKDSDIVCFTGGADVSPDLYGEENVLSSTNKSRDDREAAIFMECFKLGKPMVGICRGGQFLNVMSGGRMWQDVDNHTRQHEVVLLPSNMVIRVTSTHHQMMRPSNNATILGYAEEALYKKDSTGEYSVDKLKDWTERKDMEILFYQETKSLCFQPHPEYKDCPKETVNVFFNLIEEYLVEEE